jgi:uncharacterized membrane protein SpoIIM required for sporulation
MNQQTFQARHESQWLQFERWLDHMTPARRATQPSAPFAEDAVAGRYRTLCQHLALARERQYSPALVERLHRLVIRGHQFLYGAHPGAGPAVFRFFAQDFARAARARWRVIALSCALFFVPLFVLAGVMQRHPDMIYLVMSPDQVASYERMYDPAQQKPDRDAQADAYMFGHYIWNNVRIGFQTFAGGLLFGLGTIFFLTVNGVLIGSTAGYLIEIGHARPFLAFVSGHSAFELTGIVLMGAAGLMLGAALVSPGRLTRASALRLNARSAVPLVYGAGALLILAAFIEAFWSALTAPPAAIKYAFGIGLWFLVFAYFLLAGRDRAP